MKLTPNSVLKIYKNVDVDYETTIAFPSENSREAYFSRHLVCEVKPVQIVRKTGQIKFPLKLLNGVMLEECNYLSFQNPHYDNKLWYGVILSKEYLNNSTAVITYAIDYWMSNMFNVRYGDMLIERQHVSVSEWNELQSNPYTPTVHEMRTPEFGLVVGEDLQKRNYQLGNKNDAYFMCDVDTGLKGEMYHVIYITQVDWQVLRTEGLDYDTWQFWQDLLQSFQNGKNANGFYFDPDGNETVAGTLGVGGWSRGWNNTMSHPYWVLGFYVNPDGTPEDADFNLAKLVDQMTKSGVQEAILGIYAIPDDVIRNMGTLVEGQEQIPNPHVINVTGRDTTRSDYSNADPKLANYPFSYLRITKPDGNSKEYKYEDFVSNQNGQNKEVFALTGDLSERPKLIVQPDNYKIVSGAYGNPLEAVIYDQFPTAPYSIDAWTAQFAAIATNMIANADAASLSNIAGEHFYRSQDNVLGKVTSVGDFIGSFGDSGSVESSVVSDSAGNMDATGGVGVGIQTATNGLRGVSGVITKKEASRAIMGAWEDVQAAKAGGVASGMHRMYDTMRQAYVVDHYMRSTGDGMCNYNRNGMLDILVTHVRLMPYILQQYTKYFACYGYRSLRNGIPHVIGYTKGNDEPAWRTVNGKKSTYVKTIDAKVYAHDITISDKISNILNSGIRMLKGDELA